MNVRLPVPFWLPKTATYAHRDGVLAWAVDGYVDTPAGELIPALAKLTLRLQKAKRRRGLKPVEFELDTYALDEVEPTHFGCRTFELLNLTDRTQTQPYAVTVGPVVRCRCMAGDCKVATGCKHVHALEHLINEGWLGAGPTVPALPVADDDVDDGSPGWLPAVFRDVPVAAGSVGW